MELLNRLVAEIRGREKRRLLLLLGLERKFLFCSMLHRERAAKGSAVSEEDYEVEILSC